MGKHFKVVGMKYHISNTFWESEIQLDDLVLVMPEPKNTYDKNAKAVYLDKKKIGYIAMDEAKECEPGLYYIVMKQGFPTPYLMEVVAYE